MSKYFEEDLSKVRPISISDRSSKVGVGDFVDPELLDETAESLSDSFPAVLKGQSLRKIVSALHDARENNKEIVWLIGSHVLKCGLSLYINSLMRHRYITAIATTGSLPIHDLEMAFFGETSEDVGEELPRGRFGMSRETFEHFAGGCEHAREKDLGLGEGLGSYICSGKAANEGHSIFATAFKNSVPVTVHVAFGTDITHQHPGFPAAIVGDLTMRDFRILTARVGKLFDNGVVVVFGSAVVLPEVFLKAVSINYNLGRSPKKVTAASFDMMSQYRVRENVLTRPFKGSGKSHSISGHHELMLPLLYRLLPRQ